jgi:hypothetical protein
METLELHHFNDYGRQGRSVKKDEVPKSRRPSYLIGGSGEISIVGQGHPALTTSRSLNLGESNHFRIAITQSPGAPNS